MWTEKGMRALQVSQGCQQEGQQFSPELEEGDCHEETLDPCQAACPVVGAHGTKMNKHKAQSLGEERDMETVTVVQPDMLREYRRGAPALAR